MILAALEGDCAAILLTNNILPPANLISLATERGVPMLLAAEDTFAVAKQVDDLELLLTRDDEEKVARLTALVREHLDLKAIVGA
jgi:BioD-like phosphotransacetylase family protein